MKNVRIKRTRTDIVNGWVVIADTKRFGKNEILFEGSYKECWQYVSRMQSRKNEKFRVTITGNTQFDWAQFEQ